MNIDVVRRLAAVHSPQQAVALVKLLAEKFGGLSYLKCLPELADTNPPAADERCALLTETRPIKHQPHCHDQHNARTPHPRQQFASPVHALPSLPIATHVHVSFSPHRTMANSISKGTTCSP